jgi:hypothetical protein
MKYSRDGHMIQRTDTKYDGWIHSLKDGWKIQGNDGKFKRWI